MVFCAEESFCETIEQVINLHFTKSEKTIMEANYPGSALALACYFRELFLLHYSAIFIGRRCMNQSPCIGQIASTWRRV
jgi:hypothetical protein